MIEIERKFLVNDMSFKDEAISADRIVQGYICRESGRTVRIRISEGKGYLTIKGPSDSAGMSRYEWEKEIPTEDAEALLGLCTESLIDKTRYVVPERGNDGRFFEVDVFHGDNDGLVVAEIELGSENDDFVRPAWLAREVTSEKKYYNSMLAAEPYKNWKSREPHESLNSSKQELA